MHDLATIVRLNLEACEAAREADRRKALTVDGREIFTAHVGYKKNEMTKKIVLAYEWPIPFTDTTEDIYNLLIQLRKENGRANEAARGEKDKPTVKLTDRRLKALQIVIKFLFDMGEKFRTEWPVELAEELDWLAAKIEGII